MIAMVPASFDPVTSGHVDIIERAARIFDQVWVVVFHNPRKTATFTPAERVEMLRKTTAHLPNVRVDSSDGLAADYAHAHGVKVMVKGLRAFSDFEYEYQMAQMNKKLDDGIETLFMMTSTPYSFVSSSLVKEVAQFGGNLEGLVPSFVEEKLRAKFERG